MRTEEFQPLNHATGEGRPWINGGKANRKTFNRETSALKEVAKRCRKTSGDKESNKNRAFLEKCYELAKGGVVKPNKLWRDVSSSDRRDLQRKASKCTLDLIIYVYALYWEVVTSPFFEIHLGLICESLEIKPHAGMDILSLVARAAVDYRETGKDGQLKVNRRALSRHVVAIRHLESENIRPWEVRAHQEKNGGGVDRWHRKPKVLAKTTASEDGGDQDSASDEPIDEAKDSESYLEESASGSWRGAGQGAAASSETPLPAITIALPHLAPGQGRIVFVVGAENPTSPEIFGSVGTGAISTDSRNAKIWRELKASLEQILRRNSMKF